MSGIPIIGPVIDWFVGGVAGIGDGIVGAVFRFIGSVFDGLMSAVSGIINLLPNAVDLGIPDLSGWVHGYTYLNAFLPISDALVGWGLYLGVANAGFLFNLGLRIWHAIPKPFMGT